MRSVVVYNFFRRFFSLKLTTDEEFNHDLSVDGVEKKPSIWDTTCSLNSNKIIKMKASEEIVLISS